MPAEEAPLTRNADGIVALTGGASRIADAIELLASGRGKRLLISGANRATNSNEISRLNPEFERWVRCCVDFDRSLNTLGNAIETKRWAERRGFRSLIVVTSNYHMPRALAEIAHQLPDVALVPFAGGDGPPARRSVVERRGDGAADGHGIREICLRQASHGTQSRRHRRRGELKRDPEESQTLSRKVMRPSGQERSRVST